MRKRKKQADKPPAPKRFLLNFIKRLLNVGDDVVGVFNTYRKSYKIGGYAALDKLLIGELTVS